jgi:hypothetical protein
VSVTHYSVNSGGLAKRLNLVNFKLSLDDDQRKELLNTLLKVTLHTCSRLRSSSADIVLISATHARLSPIDYHSSKTSRHTLLLHPHPMPMLRLADQVDQVQLVKGSKTEWKRRKGSVSAAQHQGSVTDAYITSRLLQCLPLARTLVDGSSSGMTHLQDGIELY